jgi:hypothetical protein
MVPDVDGYYKGILYIIKTTFLSDLRENKFLWSYFAVSLTNNVLLKYSYLVFVLCKMFVCLYRVVYSVLFYI